MSAKRPAGAKRELQAMLLIGLLGVGILYVYFLYIFSPLSREAANVGRGVRAAQEKLRALEAATANEVVLKEQYRQVDDTVHSLRTAMPIEAELPSVMEFLSSLASKTNVKIQTIFPKRQSGLMQPQALQQQPKDSRKDEEAVYKEIPIQIDALAGYHELGTFLSLLETGERPMQVASLRISGNPKESRRHQINLVIQSYFAVVDETATGSPKTAQGS